MANHPLMISAFICFVVSTIFLLGSSSFEHTRLFSAGQEPFTFADSYVRVPYSASWGSWWHPRRIPGTAIGIISENWNLLYHLGGNSPWIEKVDGIVKGGIGVPEGCEIQQVHMMARHAERYPTSAAGGRMLDLLNRIKDLNFTLKGELEFANDWEYFSQDPGAQLEQLTTTGPFAGTLEAFTTGVKLRTRYHDLQELWTNQKLHFWASGSNRVVQTARYFAAGFLGLDWEDKAELHVIPEAEDLGADTLTPGDTCTRYRTDLEFGHDYGANMLTKFRATYLGKIGDRLKTQNPGISFSDAEIYSMQEMCGFEIIARGSSPWCSVFSRKDWENFEYARDIIHYYRAGPGNPYGPVMGLLWLNATAKLLAQGPTAGPLFLSFVHDGDIVPMLAALNLFPDENDLPVTYMMQKRNWRMTQVVPMGGRVLLERMSCSARSDNLQSEHEKAREKKIFIRINVNDGIVAIPRCTDGPQSSCSLHRFLELVRQRGRELGDFRDICGLDENSPGEITFLHQ